MQRDAVIRHHVGATSLVTSGAVAGGFRDNVCPLITRYCLDCHSTADKTADVDFERFASAADVPAHPVGGGVFGQRFGAPPYPTVLAAAGGDGMNGQTGASNAGRLKGAVQGSGQCPHGKRGGINPVNRRAALKHRIQIRRVSAHLCNVRLVNRLDVLTADQHHFQIGGELAPAAVGLADSVARFKHDCATKTEGADTLKKNEGRNLGVEARLAYGALSAACDRPNTAS